MPEGQMTSCAQHHWLMGEQPAERTQGLHAINGLDFELHYVIPSQTFKAGGVHALDHSSVRMRHCTCNVTEHAEAFVLLSCINSQPGDNVTKTQAQGIPENNAGGRTR